MQFLQLLNDVFRSILYHYELSGEGEDSTGPFTIEGVFHRDTNRVILRMQYIQATTARYKFFAGVNQCHKAYIRLKPVQSGGHAFKGYWYVNTAIFEDVDRMTLR